MARILLGIVLGCALFPATILLWLQYGKPPVAVADKPFFKEEALTRAPLQYRVPREAPKAAPILADEENLVAGAHIYREQCSVCHGLHGKQASVGTRMYPMATPMWEKRSIEDVVGVSSVPAGETYWKISHGIRLSGMPAYQGVLTDTELWQVSLLLANANKPLPPAAIDLVKGQGTQGASQAEAKPAGAPKG